jgi:hypothetical protein
MKKLAGISMFLTICLLFAFMINVEVAVSSSTVTTQQEADLDDDYALNSEDDATIRDQSEEDVSEKVVIPDTTDMTLGMQDSENLMPDNFRGGDPDRGLVHVLEDLAYVKHEHALIYQADATEIADGAEFESDPNITWDTKIRNADGSFTDVEEPKNTNMAADSGAFFVPGEYQIGNSGARQVGSIDGADDADEADGAKTVTAQQSMGVLAHDVTPPDLWIALQETAGSRDIPQTEKELLLTMQTEIVAKKARPIDDMEAFKTTNYLFIEEGETEERNVQPWEKSARVTVAGPMFNEDGAVNVESGVIDTLLLSQEEQTRLTSVVADSNQNVKGIFVRRNVPFIFTAVATDNGDQRQTSGITSYNVEAGIFDESGNEVDKVNDSYIFRVPNYPLNEHKDQEVYVFKARAKDFSGNLTEVAMPVYVIDSYSSFESRGR